MNAEKRVIILERVDSPIIAQAIFILRDDAPEGFSAVQEAERIVGEFLTSGRGKGRSARWLGLLCAALFVAAGCLFLSIFNIF